MTGAPSRWPRRPRLSPPRTRPTFPPFPGISFCPPPVPESILASPAPARTVLKFTRRYSRYLRGYVCLRVRVPSSSSHKFLDQEATLHTLWPKLRPGGFYVIEDMLVGGLPWDAAHAKQARLTPVP